MRNRLADEDGRICRSACARGSRRPPVALQYRGTARVRDADDGTPVRLYQAMLLGKDGGYFRLIGIATQGDEVRLAPDFPKIAQSFALVP